MNNNIEVLITENDIFQAVKRMAEEINKEYYGESLLVVCTLKGATVFFADLIRRLELNTEIDFISASSYGESTVSTGEVVLKRDIDADPINKNILLVEDIIDTGYTMQKVMKMFESRGAKSVKLCSMLDKPSRRKVDLTPDFKGFEIPDKFVVGYGMDYNEKFRNLPYIGVLKW